MTTSQAASLSVQIKLCFNSLAPAYRAGDYVPVSSVASRRNLRSVDTRRPTITIVEKVKSISLLLTVPVSKGKRRRK